MLMRYAVSRSHSGHLFVVMVRHMTASATVHVRATAIPHHQIKKSHKKENGYNGLHRSSPPFTTVRVKTSFLSGAFRFAQLIKVPLVFIRIDFACSISPPQ